MGSLSDGDAAAMCCVAVISIWVGQTDPQLGACLRDGDDSISEVLRGWYAPVTVAGRCAAAVLGTLRAVGGRSLATAAPSLLPPVRNCRRRFGG